MIAFAASTSVPVTPLSLTVSRVCARRPRLPRACYAPNDGGGSTGAFRSSAARGVSLRVFERTWSPAPSAPAPSAGLLILPGGGGHSGWFGELARALAERAGCRVVGLDFLGNGKSDSIDGLRSYMRELEDHLGDARKSLEGLRDGLPDGTPLFVLSESQGGIEAAMLALETTGVVEDVAGWIFCGPAFRLAPAILPPAPVLALAKILARFFPRAVLPGDGVSGETFDKAFGTKELADLAKVDPLTDTFGMKVRLGTMTTLLPCFDRLQEEMGNVRMKNLLIMHNEQDCRTEFEASKEFVEKVHCDGVVELFNPGGTGHQLFQETLEITQAAIDKAVGFVQNVTARESAAVSTGS